MEKFESIDEKYDDFLSGIQNHMVQKSQLKNDLFGDEIEEIKNFN